MRYPKRAAADFFVRSVSLRVPYDEVLRCRRASRDASPSFFPFRFFSGSRRTYPPFVSFHLFGSGPLFPATITRLLPLKKFPSFINYTYVSCLYGRSGAIRDFFRSPSVGWLADAGMAFFGALYVNARALQARSPVGFLVKRTFSSRARQV